MRQAAVRPKRAARRFPITAANSASGNVALCSLSAESQSRGSRLKSEIRPSAARTAATAPSFSLWFAT
ncbi:MAG TPA: hypothetical protein VH853_12960 [Polyangia bacterium]|nr:hypothetical protein [Polyangia bacterium]